MVGQIDMGKLFRPRSPEEIQSDVLSYILVPGNEMCDVIATLIGEGLKVYDNPFREPLQFVTPDMYTLNGYVLKAWSNLDITINSMRWDASNISAYLAHHRDRCFMWDEICIPVTMPEIDVSPLL